MESIKNISRLVQRVYNGKAWHGPSIMDVLKEIDETSSRKAVGNSHSIIQLVMHMASWRTFVTRRLLGDSTFELSEDQNFPEGTDWNGALKALDASQSELLKAIDSITEDQLHHQVADRKYDFFVLLHGIIHHDVYHLGQIQLISKYA